MTKRQKSALTHTEVTGRNDPVDEHVFHASLPLYILLERCPRLDNPNWVDIGCWRHGEIEGMMVYLSPIDAMIDLYDRNANGSKYEIYPFVSIDPRDFIQEHGGWFTVCLVYGFAARDKQLVLSERENLMAMVNITHFRISDEMFQHFHLEFGDATHAWLDRLHRGAGVPDYNRQIAELGKTSFFELNQLAGEALERVGSRGSGADSISSVGIYDSVEQRWRFAALADHLPQKNHHLS